MKGNGQGVRVSSFGYQGDGGDRWLEGTDGVIEGVLDGGRVF